MKWIDINKEEPKVGQKTLVLIDVGENIERGEYLGGGNFRGNWCGRVGKDHCYKVTHWMQKPTTPENYKSR